MFFKKSISEPEGVPVPTILMEGHKIVEVGLTYWSEKSDGTWGMTEGVKIDIVSAGKMDKVVFETPIGCFEKPMHYNLAPGDSLELIVGIPSGPGLRECQRPTLAELEAEVCEPIEVEIGNN